MGEESNSGMSGADSVTLRPGGQVGRYMLVRKIGTGGMGAVYEGIHAELRKRAAVKVLLPPSSENPDLRARFLREGQAAARIRHPHVVDIYDVGEQGGLTFLIMEFLEGEDLLRLLRREHRMSIERAVDLMLPVIAAIGAAHREGVIHRDLKPGNIFLSRGAYGDVVPKVLDFGISKLINDAATDNLTQTGAVMGTPFYMSPEQALGGRFVDARSDQYSLAVIFYQMVTGKRPFEADSMYSILHSIVQGMLVPPRDIDPAIPEALEDAILRAMSKAPAERFPNVGGFANAILPFASPRARALWSGVFAGTDRGAVRHGGVTDLFVGQEALERTETSPPVALADPALSDAAILPGESTGLNAHGSGISQVQVHGHGVARLRLLAIAASLLVLAAVCTIIYAIAKPREVRVIDARPVPVESSPSSSVLEPETIPSPAPPAPRTVEKVEGNEPSPPPRTVEKVEVSQPPTPDEREAEADRIRTPVKSTPKRSHPTTSPGPRRHVILKGKNGAPVLD
jgi:eukaryotic-like serine/threonine-protein kinase